MWSFFREDSGQDCREAASSAQNVNKNDENLHDPATLCECTWRVLESQVFFYRYHLMEVEVNLVGGILRLPRANSAGLAPAKNLAGDEPTQPTETLDARYQASREFHKH